MSIAGPIPNNRKSSIGNRKWNLSCPGSIPRSLDLSIPLRPNSKLETRNSRVETNKGRCFPASACGGARFGIWNLKLGFSTFGFPFSNFEFRISNFYFRFSSFERRNAHSSPCRRRSSRVFCTSLSLLACSSSLACGETTMGGAMNIAAREKG